MFVKSKESPLNFTQLLLVVHLCVPLDVHLVVPLDIALKVMLACLRSALVLIIYTDGRRMDEFRL